MSFAPSTVDEIDTPAMVINKPVVAANIARAQAYAKEHGLRLRPHIKTHKLPEMAREQLNAGAAGINCQKISEAEAMVNGLQETHSNVDVLVTFNIVGERKLARAMELAKRTQLTLVADSSTVVAGYARAAEKAGIVLNVMVECDTGGLRAGVTQPDQALELAQLITKHESLRFAGLMTYPAKHAVDALSQWLVTAQQAFTVGGLPIPAITVGGTPDMWAMHEVAGITEMRPGTYIYNDRAIVSAKAAKREECAQTVLATVVSRPLPTRVVIDAGSKALSMDPHGGGGYGEILGYPHAKIDRISEEHGVVEAVEPEHLPPIGARVHIVPNHACVVSNLFNEAIIVDGETVLEVLPIAARGCVF